MKNLLTIFAILTTAFAGIAQEKNFIDQPYVEVAGSADTAVTPDEIYLRIVVPDGAAKQSQMISTLKSTGVNTDKDLVEGDAGSEFGAYDLKYPQFNNNKYKTFTLKAGSPQSATEAADQLSALGITNISIDRVLHSSLPQIRAKMRSDAVANAQKNATALVKGVTQILGPALHIAEVQDEEAQKEARAKLLKAQAMPPTSFGKIKVAITVNVKFLMRYNTY